MIWLLVFGLIHFYFIWFGDILSLYALVGMHRLLLPRSPARTLIIWGVAPGARAVPADVGASPSARSQLAAAAAAPGADPTLVDDWREMSGDVRPRPSARQLAEKLALFRGP